MKPDPLLRLLLDQSLQRAAERDHHLIEVAFAVIGSPHLDLRQNRDLVAPIPLRLDRHREQRGPRHPAERRGPHRREGQPAEERDSHPFRLHVLIEEDSHHAAPAQRPGRAHQLRIPAESPHPCGGSPAGHEALGPSLPQGTGQDVDRVSPSSIVSGHQLPAANVPGGDDHAPSPRQGPFQMLLPHHTDQAFQGGPVESRHPQEVDRVAAQRPKTDPAEAGPIVHETWLDQPEIAIDALPECLATPPGQSPVDAAQPESPTPRQDLEGPQKRADEPEPYGPPKPLHPLHPNLRASG